MHKKWSPESDGSVRVIPKKGKPYITSVEVFNGDVHSRVDLSEIRAPQGIHEFVQKDILLSSPIGHVTSSVVMCLSDKIFLHIHEHLVGMEECQKLQPSSNYE